MKARYLLPFLSLAIAAAGVLWITAAEPAAKSSKPKLALSIQPQHLADALRAVIASHRQLYTEEIVERLAIRNKVIKTSLEYQKDQALIGPCHLFRLESEAVASRGVEFAYVLRGNNPLNPRNRPETEVETKGLAAVAKNPEQPFYAEEMLGGRWYFTAVYPERVTGQSCVTCHVTADRPSVKPGDVLGALVIRVALEL